MFSVHVVVFCEMPWCSVKCLCFEKCFHAIYQNFTERFYNYIVDIADDNTETYFCLKSGKLFLISCSHLYQNLTVADMLLQFLHEEWTVSCCLKLNG